MSPASKFSIESWCDNQIIVDDKFINILPISTQLFLQKLNLSYIHPFCTTYVNSTSNSNSYNIPNIPEQGPLVSYNYYEDGYYDYIITIIQMAIPSIAAIGELWLRLFASIISPIGITYLLYISVLYQPPKIMDNTNKNENNKNINKSSNFFSLLSIVCTLTTVSSIVILTDTLYVLELGYSIGIVLVVVSFYLSIRTCYQNKLYSTLFIQLLLLLLCFHLTYDSNTTTTTTTTNRIFHFGCPNEVTTTNVSEGLYYDHSNQYMSNLVQNHWNENFYTYKYDDTTSSSSSTNVKKDIEQQQQQQYATRWMITGDTRTGLPFLLNKLPHIKYIRVWIPMLQYDNEVVALDISFPKTGHNTSKPFYIILHGLNGGSSEEYVRDLVIRANADGCTVGIMIARGLMDLPIRSFNNFHGARWEDSHTTAQIIKAALESNQVLAGIGYSMGAIILGNMIARTGIECALDVGIAISGGLDMRQQINFHRAQRLWQPILTTELRDTFVLGKWGERVYHRLTKQQMKQLMRSTHITEIDKTAVVAYNGFPDLIYYYSEMSVLGDIPFHPTSYVGHNIPSDKRVHNISIPFVVVHALDDPLITWRAVAANDGIMAPTTLTKTGSGNLLILLTKRGGHVGWPLGFIPTFNGWKWMSDIAMSFTNAVVSTPRSDNGVV